MAQYQWKAPNAAQSAMGQAGGMANSANQAKPTGNPTSGGNKNVKAGGPAGGAPKPPAPAANTGGPAAGGKQGKPPSTPQPGQTGPFGMQSWYGGNPLQTAQNLANQNLQQQLGGIRGRYGASGLGNSSREALAEGTAAAQSATGLGDVLAQRGLGAYESDANRALAANQQLMNAGTGLTAIGSQEQQMPGMQALMGLLGQLSGQNIFSQFLQTGNQGYWT